MWSECHEQGKDHFSFIGWSIVMIIQSSFIATMINCVHFKLSKPQIPYSQQSCLEFPMTVWPVFRFGCLSLLVSSGFYVYLCSIGIMGESSNNFYIEGNSRVDFLCRDFHKLSGQIPHVQSKFVDFTTHWQIFTFQCYFPPNIW